MPSRNHYQFRNLSQHFDKILFAITCTYLVFISLWLITSGKIRLSFSSNTDKQSVAQDRSANRSDAEFIAYMQQSLAAIDQKLAVNQPQNSPTASHSPVKVPPAPVLNQSSSETRNAPTVIEKIYVPIYPPNQPSVATSPTLRLPPQPPSAPPSSVPVLTPGAKHLPSPTRSYTLVGLLSGDRSYALFDINGVSQRIELGEEIGTSGWRLISVKQTKVGINRNGQQRYIEVGQKF